MENKTESKQTESVPTTPIKSTPAQVRAFFNDMRPFLTQCVSGNILNVMRLNRAGNVSLNFNVVVKMYLNTCWHGYWRDNDKYVIETFNKLLAHKVINGTVCLIHWVDRIAGIIIDRLGFDNMASICNALPNISTLRELLNSMVAGVYDTIFDSYGALSCEGSCKNEYNNQDLYEIKTYPIQGD